MKKPLTHRSAMLILCAAFVFVSLSISRSQVITDDDKTGASEYTYSQPYSYKNLTIYIIRGKDRVPAKSYITLEQAMERKLVTVFETGSVNELSVQNESDKEAIFIQSGDIVKGGKQDRTMAFDMILPPKSGKLAINAFCVEHGRWSGRGGESVAAFHSSNDAIASKELKLAAKYRNDQSEVWAGAGAMQDKLSANVHKSVNAPMSSTSLQLSLEDTAVRSYAEEYIDKLASAAGDSHDAIGYVFFINGKLNSSDIYGSHDLFMRLWKKLLKASATEAVADMNEETNPPASLEDFKHCIADAAKAESSDRTINTRTKMIVKDAAKSILFETHDEKLAQIVHSNYLTKDENTPKRNIQRGMED